MGECIFNTSSNSKSAISLQPESSNHEITLIALTPPTVTDKFDNTKKDEVKQGFVELFYKETKKNTFFCFSEIP